MWQIVCNTEDAMVDGGICVKVGERQIALFYIARQERWYAVQNNCPHRQAMVLARGMTGEAAGRAKVSCPLHKNCFDLETGEHLSGNSEWRLETYPIKAQEGRVWLSLPLSEPVYV